MIAVGLLLVLLVVQPGYSARMNMTADSELFDAEQSSTFCHSGTCYSAERGINGDWDYASVTKESSYAPWWQARMTKTVVHQIELKAWTINSEMITVELYNGGVLGGHCQAYINDRDKHILECDAVEADRVRLAVTNTKKTKLYVYEIRVVYKAKCFRPYVWNADIAPTTQVIPKGSFYTATCDPGTALTGPSKLTCSHGLPELPTCTPVASFALASSVPAHAHSPDYAIDDDLNTYTATSPAAKSWYKVYLASRLWVGEVTFKAYCFSPGDTFSVFMVYKEGDRLWRIKRECGVYKCQSYGEVMQSMRCDYNGNVIRVEHKPVNKEEALVLFDIRWTTPAQ